MAIARFHGAFGYVKHCARFHGAFGYVKHCLIVE
jgi:prenyltransferase beta subunit